MKRRLKCEVCGSNDIIKRDGVFLCQVCTTKYDLSEVRSLWEKSAAEPNDNVPAAHTPLKSSDTSADTKQQKKTIMTYQEEQELTRAKDYNRMITHKDIYTKKETKNTDPFYTKTWFLILVLLTAPISFPIIGFALFWKMMPLFLHFVACLWDNDHKW